MQASAPHHRIVLAAATLGAGAHAFAGQELMALEYALPREVAKEKIRMAARSARPTNKASQQGNSCDSTSSGSQNIGNIDTGGRIGAQPREVFVFAPNTINIVPVTACSARPRKGGVSNETAQSRAPPRAFRRPRRTCRLPDTGVRQPTMDQTNEIRKGPEDRPARAIRASRTHCAAWTRS